MHTGIHSARDIAGDLCLIISHISFCCSDTAEWTLMRSFSKKLLHFGFSSSQFGLCPLEFGRISYLKNSDAALYEQTSGKRTYQGD